MTGIEGYAFFCVPADVIMAGDENVADGCIERRGRGEGFGRE